MFVEPSSEETERKEQSPPVPDGGGDMNFPMMSFTPVRGKCYQYVLLLENILFLLSVVIYYIPYIREYSTPSNNLHTLISGKKI